MKKDIYLIQANPVYSENDRTVYIPYAIGCLAAYAWADPFISEEYRLGRFVYTRADIEETLSSWASPYLVAFSCSIWNMEYNKAFAKALKEKFPNCLILFGGHHVSPDESNLLEYDYVDFLVHGGGEEAFKSILLSLAGKEKLEDIPNISYRSANGRVVSTPKILPQTTDYPSPYLEGYFDEIMEDDIKFSAIIETNRGCPNKCAFCDWGVLQKKVFLFPLEKIYKELEWVAKNSIEYIYCADANFGLFKRDENITDYLAHLKKTYGFPQRFRVNIAKDITDTLKSIIEKFHINELDKALPLSYQSLSPEVLKNIGRKNMDLKHFGSLMSLYNRLGVSTSSELILGLPGETFESFCRGICSLLEYGQHRSISVYACEILPNSQLGSKEYRSFFDIKSVKVPFYQIHCKLPDSKKEILEYSDIVVSTNTMPAEDWVKSAVFSFFVQALHNLGLVRCLALYMRYEQNVPFFDFYQNFIDWAKRADGTFINSVFSKITSLASGIAQGENAWVVIDSRFGELAWCLEEITYLEFALRSDDFYKEFGDYLKEAYFFSDKEEDLLSFQREILKKLGIKTQPIKLGYNFIEYFEAIYNGNPIKLTKTQSEFNFEDKTAYGGWEDYARDIVWLGRREDSALYTGSRYKFSV
ncbi:MAG TPA: cobalamin-dependent protein [Clostridiales bacterium]|nr:cobalamin-dependent protein [Clostridiales bacterium]